MPYVTITTPEGEQKAYSLPLDTDVITIGRGDTCTIKLSDEAASRTHAEIRRVRGGFYIADCQSTRGIQCNGESAPSFALQNGSVITLGNSLLTLTFSDDEIASLLAEGTSEAQPSQATSATPTAPLIPEVEAISSHDTAPLSESEPSILPPEPPTATDPIALTPVQAESTPIQSPAAPLAKKPAPAPIALGAGGPRRPGGYVPTKKKAGFPTGYIFLILILCAISVFAGMFIRHWKETGQLLTDTLFGTEPTPVVIPTVVEPPKPKPVVEPKKDEPGEPKEKPKAMVITEDDAASQTEKEVDPHDTMIKSKGNLKLPALKEFLIP